MTMAPHTGHRHLVGLDEPAARDPSVVGTKAAGLAQLASAGFAVPDGVVLRPLGVRHIDLPLTAERVWRALQNPGQGEGLEVVRR